MSGTHTPSSPSPDNISRRDILGAGILLAAGVKSTLAEGATVDSVKASTREAVAALQKEFPKFKLSREAQQCFDGTLIDPECNPAIMDEVSLYKDQQELAMRKQQLDAKDKQLDILQTINQNVEVAIGLIQLGIYVDSGKAPNTQADFIKKVQSNPETPQEIQKLFSDILQKHKTGETVPYNPYGKKLLEYVVSYMNNSIKLQEQILDPKAKREVNDITQSIRTMYSGLTATKLVQKAG